MREMFPSNESAVRIASLFPNNKRAYEQIKLKHQESHRQAFIKLNKNAPYGQGAGQMNKPLKKKKSISPITVCLPGAGATRDLIDAGRCGETLRREESDNFMFR